MKVLHITTGYNHGGAAIACKRIVEAQRSIGIDAEVLTQERGDFPSYVHSTTKSWWKEKLNFFRHAWEKFVFLFYEVSPEIRFQFSLANTGEQFDSKLLKEADIIHLHWFNAGFVSIKGLKYIFSLGKPVVWTLHDMWAFTGGCHLKGECSNFMTQCGECQFLKKKARKDLSHKIWAHKKNVYKPQNMNIVTPSLWMSKLASASCLLRDMSIKVIPNPISNLTIVQEQDALRREFALPINKKLLLFGAFSLKNTLKGGDLLLEAIGLLPNTGHYELVVFGGKGSSFPELSIPVHNLGYICNEMTIRKLYKAADLFVTPSLVDNLPNTVLESMSVGTPVVAFDMGGMPDMIDHKKNGYLARYRDTKDLAEGVRWVLEEADSQQLSKYAIQQVEDKFSFSTVARQFENLYSNLLT